jgi:hypothetical protein
MDNQNSAELTETKVHLNSAFKNIAGASGHLIYYIQTHREIPENSLEAIKDLLKDALNNLNQVQGLVLCPSTEPATKKKRPNKTK